MTSLHQLSWMCSTIATSISLFVAFFYWSFIFPPESVHNVGFYNLFAHAGVPLIMLIDLFITRRPFRWHHVYLTISFGIALVENKILSRWKFEFLSCFSYMIFSVIYELNGGKNHTGDSFIYYFIDWRKSIKSQKNSITTLDTFILDPLQANEVAALSFLFVIVHHMIACGLVKLRIAVAMSLLKNENRNPVA